jgi:hypothetical protein
MNVGTILTTNTDEKRRLVVFTSKCLRSKENWNHRIKKKKQANFILAAILNLRVILYLVFNSNFFLIICKKFIILKFLRNVSF